MINGKGTVEMRSGTSERIAPRWCRILMEISLWSAVATGVFLVDPFGIETTRMMCTALIAVMTLMWLLHGIYLRRPPVVFSISSLAGIGLLAYFIIVKWHKLGDDAIIALVCLPVFLALPGAFTGRQVSRFLAFLCFAGAGQVLYCLVSPTLFGNKESLFQSLGEGNGISGTLNTEAELTAFLACSACAAAAFAMRALTVSAPERGGFSTGEVVNRLASPGANQALLSMLCTGLVLVPLFLCRSLFPFLTVVLAGIFLTALLAARRLLLSSVSVTLVIVILLAAGAANLALPAWGEEAASRVKKTSDSAFLINLENLKDGIDSRSGALLDEGRDWKSVFGEGDWGKAFSMYGPTAFFLLIVFGALLLGGGFRALIKYMDIQPALLAGAIGGFLALLLTGLWGNFLANPGIAILASAFCAMIAAGGEYDEEFEEIEIIT